MILRRLYELASWAELLSDPSVETTPLACLVKIGRSGNYNGLVDTREAITLPPASLKGKPKLVKSAGLPLLVPLRAVLWDLKAKRWKVTDPAVSGKERPAAFLADTLARVLPLDGLIEAEAAKAKGKKPADEVAKCRAQRSTFWRFMRFAAEQSRDPTLGVLANFGDQVLTADPNLVARVQADVEKAGLSLSSLCTLEWTADDGPILTNADVMAWWRSFYEADAASQQANLSRGICQVTHQVAPMSGSVAIRVNGLTPIGCRAEAYLVVGLEAANSYGLDGAQAGMVSAAGIDGFTRALHALLENRLPSKGDKTRVGGMRSSMRVGGTQFLFWTRDMESPSGVEILDAKPDQFAGLLELLKKAAVSTPDSIVNPDEFRILALGGNSARVVVRDYLERPLPEVQRNLLRWFADLSIADPSKEYQGRPNAAFPLWLLANATALEADRVAPDTHARLMHAALTGGLLPDSVLIAALGRLRVEGNDAFRPARMGLIKLCLKRKELPVTETLNADERHPAYVYGRLLEVFAQIQYAALGDVNANVVDKFYGTFSAAPAMVFGRLIANAQNHLRKIRGEKPGTAAALEQRLIEVRRLLTAAPPPVQFSLQDQGRFALGYYHEKAKRFEQIAEKKAEKAAKAKADDKA